MSIDRSSSFYVIIKIKLNEWPYGHLQTKVDIIYNYLHSMITTPTTTTTSTTTSTTTAPAAITNTTTATTCTNDDNNNTTTNNNNYVSLYCPF